MRLSPNSNQTRKNCDANKITIQGLILTGYATLATYSHATSDMVNQNVMIAGQSLSFAHIPSGSFMMGDKDGQKDERPRHQVSIAAFYLQTTELPKSLYAQFIKSNPSLNTSQGCMIFDGEWRHSASANWENPGYNQDSDHPAVCTSWNDAQAFLRWANDNAHPQGIQFRLPSEAEWEYASRAGSEERYHWGSNGDGLCTHANASDKRTLQRFPSFKSNTCDDGFLETAPVGQFTPNSFGLYDMYGNAWEWVEDCWNNSYHGAPNDGSARQTGDCTRRIFRGGAWGDNPHFARSGLRNRSNANIGKDDVGFRLVLVKTNLASTHSQIDIEKHQASHDHKKENHH